MANVDTKMKIGESGEECCYQLCTKETTCGGYLPYGKFKSRSLSLMCCIFTIMVTSLFIAVIVPLLVYQLVEEGINSEVVIDSTSASNYKAWSTNAEGPGFDDLKIKYKLYYFDLQNPNETLHGEKPVVVEVGPYVYDEYFVKFDIEWTDHGDTVSYNTQKYYIFSPSDSGAGLTEDDTFLLPYPAVLGFQYFLSTIPPKAQAALDYVMLQKLYEIEANVTNAINEVYAVADRVKRPQQHDQYVAQIKAANASLQVLFADLNAFVARSNPTQVLFKELMCGIPSGISPFFRVKPGPAWFGYLNDPLLYGVQMLLDNVYAQTGVKVPWTAALPGAATNWTTIADTRRRRSPDVFKTGKKNINEVGRYVYYQNMTELRTCVESYIAAAPYEEGVEWPACPYYQHDWTDEEAEAHGYGVPWATDYANRIEGTDATMFGRPVRTKKIQVYISDIYRSAYMEYKQNTHWYSVPVRRYSLQEKDLYNVTENPNNAQYYSFGPSGMLNTTKAVAVPVFVSFPHFYLADPRLVQAVKGMSPNKDAHEIFLDIEPQTGLLAVAKKRLQVNYQMTSYELPRIMDNASDVALYNCLSINETIYQLNNEPLLNANLPYLDCGKEQTQELLTCLSQPSTWKLQNDEIFFPFGWTSEELVLPQSDADDLSSMLLDTESFATSMQFWCLIIAGICFAILMAMLVHNYILFRERNYSYDLYRNYKYQHEPLMSTQTDGPLDFTYNPESRGTNMAGGSEKITTTQPVDALVSKKTAESYSFTS